jgi:DtxR family transcriptional regulator, Mn-dependent transcriptional regulator
MIKDDALSASQEDYLEMIVRLIRSKGAARVRDIASRLSVAKSSVSIALRALSKRDLVHYKPYELVSLTDKGQELADRILERHRDWRRFLTDVLGADAQTAETSACRLEHAAGEEVMQRLRAFVAFMEDSEVAARSLPQAFRDFWSSRQPADKRSADIDNPDAAGEGVVSLAEALPGECVRIVKVGGGAGGRLLEMGVTRGTPVKTVRVAPMGDPVEIEVRGYKLSLRKAEAKAILVKRGNDA